MAEAQGGECAPDGDELEEEIVRDQIMSRFED